jgi:hypothetical protein
MVYQYFYIFSFFLVRQMYICHPQQVAHSWIQSLQRKAIQSLETSVSHNVSMIDYS